MIVFLTEEPSMSPVIRRVMAEVHPDGYEGHDWLIIAFQGKADLEKNMVTKVRGWNYNSPFFLIMRDNDGGDCIALKSRLNGRLKGVGKPYKIRIVCQELEGWFLGDLQAIESAYPASQATALLKKSQYADPDTLREASSVLQGLIDVTAKVGRSGAISQHLTLEKNRSVSFKVFVRAVKEYYSKETL